jgi:hypothetical protein
MRVQRFGAHAAPAPGGRVVIAIPFDPDQVWGLTMLIGPARDGAPLDLGVLGLDSDAPVIIHALPLRAKFYRSLG